MVGMLLINLLGSCLVDEYVISTSGDVIKVCCMIPYNFKEFQCQQGYVGQCQYNYRVLQNLCNRQGAQYVLLCKL